MAYRPSAERNVGAGRNRRPDWRYPAAVLLVTATLTGTGPVVASSPTPAAEPIVRLDLDAGPDGAGPTPPVQAPERPEPTTASSGRSVLSAVSAVGAAAAGAGILAALLVRRIRRRAASSSKAATIVPSSAVDLQADPVTTEASGGDLVSTSIEELTNVLRQAAIRRVLVFASSAPEFVEAATLARWIARQGVSTILVDFAWSHAAREMGIVGQVEDVLTTVASPTTFAHGINRDRTSSAHLLPVELGPIDGDRELVKEAAGAVLTTLGEAYDMTVVVVSTADADCIEAMADKDTAVVVPSRIGYPSAAARTLDELAAHGVTDAVLLMVEGDEQRLRAA